MHRGIALAMVSGNRSRIFFGVVKIIRGCTADVAFTTREKVFYPSPLAIAQTIPSHLCISPKNREKNITDQTGVQASWHSTLTDDAT